MDEYDLSNRQHVRDQLQPSISYILARMEAMMRYRAQMGGQFGEQETHQLISHVN